MIKHLLITFGLIAVFMLVSKLPSKSKSNSKGNLLREI